MKDMVITSKHIFTPRNFRLPRIWSNKILREVSPIFEGDIINVSGWNDSDKEGSNYRDYFLNANTYVISNYGGVRGESKNEEYQIDLESDLPKELELNFDVVFNHTTLEHIFDIFKAVENLCRMSRDIVIVVVPFVQQVHHQSSYLDYWRFTHYSLKHLFERNKLQVIYLSSTPYANSGIYHLCIASKYPDKWTDKLLDLSSQINFGKHLVRDSLITKFLGKLTCLTQKI